MDESSGEQLSAVEITAGIVSAYVANNHIQPGQLPGLIASTHAALAGLAVGKVEAPAEDAVEKATPVQIKKSITPDALISFVDGKPYKTLKRHLGTHGLDFDSYRARYGLPADYPTVAASYSASRSELAKNLGLGNQRRKGAEAAPVEVAAPEPAPAAADRPKRGRPRKAEATTTE